MNPSNQMKTNEEILEEFEENIGKYFDLDKSGVLHTYPIVNITTKKIVINFLLKALQAKDEQVRQEKIELPRPYAFGIVQADGEDFSQEDKGNVYMVFGKEEFEKVWKMINLTQLKNTGNPGKN